MRGLEADANEALDRHLRRDSPRPIAVALSGGGDSLALTLIADAWARAAGRDLLILTVDHGLQAASSAWTETCARLAQRLGRPFHALSWNGAKPTQGLPAAARAARHRLLADAARQADARVILLGHTADDRLEAVRMREAGATTPDPRAWSPSPAWPEGRGRFLLRPLLAARRAEIRDWLAARGETWIDDPANDDPRYARSRARRSENSGTLTPDATPALAIARHVETVPGGFRIPRHVLADAPAEDAVRLLAMACVCAGGGDRRPSTDRVVRTLAGVCASATTLAGARLVADSGSVWIAREPGEARRGGLAPMPLNVGAVWDGRYEVQTAQPGYAVRALAGVAAQLPPAERKALARLPAILRGGLPAVVAPDGAISSPILGGGFGVTIQSLIETRLNAAAGLTAREP